MLRATALVTGLAGALTFGHAAIATTPSVSALGGAAWTGATSAPTAPDRAAVTAAGGRLIRATEGPAITPLQAHVQYSHLAFPGATRLANGSLLVVYREGSKHFRARDGFIRSTTSTDLGKTWSRPVDVLPRAADIDYRDPSVSTSNNGSTLYLTYFEATRSSSAAGSFFRSSTNGGASWSREVRIDPKFRSSAITAPAVQLADGSLVTVHYSKAAGEGRDSVWLSRSRNAGATWITTRLVNGQAARRDYQEPYLVRRGAGLFLTFRWGDHDSIGSMFSSDSGATWSTPVADFRGSGRPSSVWLAGGNILVYLRDPGGNFDIRVTGDRGATWGPPRLVQSPPPGGRSTYAAFVEVAPGHVFTAMSAEDSSGTRSRMTFTYLGNGLLTAWKKPAKL